MRRVLNRPPGCYLSSDTVKRLAELRVAFDIDLIPCDPSP